MGISISKAAKEWGVSRTTLHSKIKSGILSQLSDKTIDPSEMLRVFGEPKKSSTVQISSDKTEVNSTVQLLEQQIAHEKQLRLVAEKRADRAEKQADSLLQQLGALTETVKLLEPPKALTKPPKKMWLWMLVIGVAIAVASALFFFKL